jgi:hypothetical protein
VDQPAIGAPTGRVGVVEKRIERLFLGQEIVIDRNWSSAGAAYMARVLLGEQNATSDDAATNIDPLKFDDKKIGGSVLKGLESRRAAAHWGGNLVSPGLNKVVMLTDNRKNRRFIFFPCDNLGVRTGEPLPKVTDRQQIPGFDSPEAFVVTWGANTIVEGWLGYQR